MKQFMLCIIAIVATALNTNTALAQTTAQDTVKKITIKVTNLHCNNDMPTIKKRLINQDGIDEVRFTDREGETSLFTVTYHTSVISQAQIEAAVETTPGCDDKGSTPYRVKRKKNRS